MRILIFLVAFVAALFFASQACAANWSMFAPATTSCDSYPFPFCRARSACQDKGGYWYNERCNEKKHPEQDALEKLDGYWEITMFFNICDGKLRIGSFALDKTKISDDNMQVAEFEGRTLSITSWPTYVPPEPGDVPDPYAIVGDSTNSYILKDISIDWGMGYTYSCYLKDGTVGKDHVVIEPGDTSIYSFSLVSADRMKGRVCFIKSGICRSFTGEKFPYIFP